MIGQLTNNATTTPKLIPQIGRCFCKVTGKLNDNKAGKAGREAGQKEGNRGKIKVPDQQLESP